MLDSYNAAFEVTKPAQKLKVFPSLGMVDLELELNGRYISIQVQPIYATIIYLFGDQGNLYLTQYKMLVHELNKAFMITKRFFVSCHTLVGFRQVEIVRYGDQDGCPRRDPGIESPVLGARGGFARN